MLKEHGNSSWNPDKSKLSHCHCFPLGWAKEFVGENDKKPKGPCIQVNIWDFG